MQERMFSLRLDAELRLLRVERWGLWDVEQAGLYRRALAAAVSDAAARTGAFDVLVDIGRADTMPQSAAGVMSEVASDLERGPARRIAFIGPGALKRLQVRRLFGDRSRFGTFETEVQALEWLSAAS